MTSTGLRSFAAGVLLCGLTLTHQAVIQAEERAADTLTSTAPAAQREATVSAALRTLRYITQARNAIHGDDLDQAREDVQQARELLTLIAAARPTARLREHIWVARQHMNYETAQEVIEDLALIDAELLSLCDVMPTEKAHGHLRAAQTLIKNNDTKAALRELEHLKASLIFTEFDLPLAAGEQQILAAQEALARNQPDVADSHLVAAEESIQFITLGGSAPLVSARVYLRRAANNYNEESYAAARVDLEQASESLRRTGKGADKKTVKEKDKLAAEIDAMKSKLSAATENPEHTLSGFLHRNMVLIEREAEDLWLRYRKELARDVTLRKLRDAKTHLYYAEHDLEKGGDTGAAKEELEKTDHYLEEALSEAKPAERDRITRLRKDIRALEGDLGGDREQVKLRYDAIVAELFHLIHNN